MTHVHQLLTLFEKNQKFIKNPIVVQMAIWFHDVVYNPKSPRNEEDSIIFYGDFVNNLELMKIQHELTLENSLKIREFINYTKKSLSKYKSTSSARL